MAREVLAAYEKGEVGEIYLAYTHFKNTVVHEPKLIKLLPVDIEDMPKQEEDNVLMNYEPNQEEALNLIIPKYVTSLLYGALVEAVASENGARMQAMDSATSNAEDMISDLSLKYNRARQGSITQELTEGIGEGLTQTGLDAWISYFNKETVSFLDYFDPERSMIFLDEPLRLKEQGEAVELEFRESMEHRLEKGYLLPGQTGLLYPVREILTKAQRKDTVYLTGLEQKLPGMTTEARFSFDVRNMNSYQNSFEMLIKDLTGWKKERYRVILLSGSRTRASRLAEDLREYDLSAFCTDDESREVQPGEILVTFGNLHRGFAYPQIKFAVITEGDMFGKEKKKRKRKKTSYEGKKIQSFTELSVGDYVVHEDHGLGIYRGIEKIERDGVIKDYLKVEYADNGSLYLPATRLDGIQ